MIDQRRSTTIVLFVICMSWLEPTTSSATSIYETGFEAPIFTVGNLVAQDGWATDGGGTNGTVQSALVNSGNQAVQIDGNGLMNSTWWFRDVSYTIPVATMPIIQIDWAMNVQTGSVQSSWGIDVYVEDEFPVFLKRASAMYVDDLNNIQVWDGTENAGAGGFTDSNFDATRNAWHTYRIDLNYATETADFYYDGVLIANDLAITLSPFNVLLDADLYNFKLGGGANDSAYFDDYRIQSLSDSVCAAADADCSGNTNISDIASFVNILMGNATPCSACAGDMNNDGNVDGRDVQAFVNALLTP